MTKMQLPAHRSGDDKNTTTNLISAGLTKAQTVLFEDHQTEKNQQDNKDGMDFQFRFLKVSVGAFRRSLTALFSIFDASESPDSFPNDQET